MTAASSFPYITSCNTSQNTEAVARTEAATRGALQKTSS